MAVVALPAELPARVITARELARARAETPAETVLPTGVEGFDRLLAGGLRRGETVELVAGRSSGAFSLVVAILAGVTASGETAAYVDLGDGFDPAAAATAGADLERLLWVRPRRTKEALLGAEAIVAAGLPLVVVDLGLPPVPGGRGNEAAWLRLSRSARERRVALLVVAPYRATGPAAEAVLGLRRRRAVWRLGGLPLLLGVDGELERTRERKGQRHGALRPRTERLRFRTADLPAGLERLEAAVEPTRAVVVPWPRDGARPARPLQSGPACSSSSSPTAPSERARRSPTSPG